MDIIKSEKMDLAFLMEHTVQKHINKFNSPIKDTKQLITPYIK